MFVEDGETVAAVSVGKREGWSVSCCLQFRGREAEIVWLRK